MKRLSPLTFVAMIAMVYTSMAQVERVLPRQGGSSLEGTEFVVGFMQNEVLAVGTDPRLQIFIASQYNARVTIDYPNNPGNLRFVTANTVFVEDVSPFYVVNASERIQRKAITIKSDVPIVVYLLNTLATSTDSYTAIPVKHLGTQYLTVNSPADRYTQRQSEIDTMIRLSEFMVIGTENFTEVTVVSPTRSERGVPAWDEHRFQLNKGDCYLIKSAHTPAGYGDQSGSRVSATRPVAVLSGHMRTSIPQSISHSKDHLVEMLPPMQQWGTEYATTPFELVEGGDVVRMMSASDNTVVTVETPSGTTDFTLATAGSWRDIRIDVPAKYTSDKEFFVMQFMPSYARGNVFAERNYDPAMVVVPSLNHYVSGALLQTPLLEVRDVDQSFYHFVNIIADSVSIPTLRLNNTLVSALAPELALQKIPNSNLHWAAVRIWPGVYTISADTGLFSGVMYGTSFADSYANLFGINFDPIDLTDATPPKFVATVDCGKILGSVTDYSTGEAKLERVEVQTAKTVNYTWSLSNPVDAIGTVQFSATVRDLWKDARFVIHAYDDKGNGRELTYDYRAPRIDVDRLLQFSINHLGSACERIPIVNTDSTSFRIQSMSIIGNPNFTINDPANTNVEIAANDTLWVEVCHSNNGGANSSARLRIDLGCGLTIDVVLQTNSLPTMVAKGVNFGDVRVGDTVCLPAHIVNTGGSNLTVDRVDLSFPNDITPDLSGISFPVVLKPGDTLFVPVCFTPTGDSTTARVDTVTDGSGAREMIIHNGRGVRPRFSNILVDWGKRRIGTVNDTTFLVTNSGSGPGSITTATNTIVDPPFLVPAVPVSRAFAPLENVTYQATFNPTTTTTSSLAIGVNVDWRFHEQLVYEFVGEGTQPVVTTRVIDFGDVVVGTSIDSNVVLADFAGNEDTQILSAIEVGPDQTSFTLPNTVFQTGIINLGSEYEGLVTFGPTRLGVHETRVVLRHNSGLNYTEMFDTVIVRGNAVAQPVLSADVSFALPENAVACEKDSATIEVRNSGNVNVVVSRISLTIDATNDYQLLEQTITLLPNESTRFQHPLLFEFDEPVVVEVELVLNDTIVYTESATITPRLQLPTVEMLPIRYTVSDLTGTVPIQVNVSNQFVKDTSETVTLQLMIPTERWISHNNRVVVDIDDATGSAQETLDLTFSDGVATVVLPRRVRAPYQIQYLFAGNALWKNLNPESAFVRLLENECSAEAGSEQTIVADECAGNLRSVLFGSLPIVEGRVTSTPSREYLDIELTASKNVAVDIDLVDVNGEHSPLARKYSLHSGEQLCKFSLMSWATGRYAVVIRHDNGELVLPLLLVK